MLKLRLLTALILVPLVIWGVLVLPNDYLALILGLFVVIGFWEWSGLVRMGSIFWRLLYLVAAILIMSLVWFYGRDASAIMCVMYLALAWWLTAFGWIMRPQLLSASSLYALLLKSVAGILVLVPAWLALVTIHAHADLGSYYLLFVLALTWVADSGAYFAGRKWGTHKLAPAVSPGKTREGVYGALVLVAVYSAFAGWQWDMDSSRLWAFVILCVFLTMVSVLGDLLESLIKRHGEFKDSGSIFPGHGGVLDRIDSITAVAPLFLLGMYWLGVVQ